MESVNINDTVYFGVTIHHPSGGFLTDADETPRYQVFENSSDTVVTQGAFTKRTITGGVLGTYRANFAASNGNGFESGKYYEIHASGKVNDVVGRAIIKSFVVDDVYRANIVEVSSVAIHAPEGHLKVDTVKVSGERTELADIVDANILQVSGQYVSIEDFHREDNVYYADIKFIKDKTNTQDEYTVSWFRNTTPLGSGDIAGPRIRVVKASDGTDLIADRTLNYQSPVHGVLRYNETTNANIAVSGEPYVVYVSGVIDSQYRQFMKIVGIDELY